MFEVVEILFPEKSPLRWVYMYTYSFFVSGPNFVIFCSDNAVLRFSSRRSISEILRSKSKVVRNCIKFLTFLPSQILLEDPFQKLYPRRLIKFHEVIATKTKVIAANTLNFKPNFKCSPLKFFGGP